MSPPTADMIPDIDTAEAVISPDDLRINLPLELLIKFEPNSNPPTTPLLNKTSEPVICPESFSMRELLELDMVDASILKPPISPDVAAIFPDKSTLDAVMFPFNK